MIIRSILRLICLLIATFFLCIQPAVAVKIVRLQLEYGGDGLAGGGYAYPKVNRALDLELYDDVTSGTVANYLNYVNSDLYDLTFFNRSLSGLAIEAGSVTNISADPENEPLGPSFGVVPTFPPILNEPGLSNLRGTVAMAKDKDDPDSATSAWYINISDNSDPLDTNIGGHTVFGSVIDDGMEIADEINAFPTANLGFLYGAAYTDLPFADYEPAAGELIFQSNLVMILSATEISRPILRFAPADGDFGFDLPGDSNSNSIELVLRNTGNEVLVIDSIDTGSVSAPFSIQLGTCSTIVNLAPVSDVPASSCTINLQFLATVDGMFSDTLTIGYSGQVSGQVFSVKYPLSGEGALAPPEIMAAAKLDVGTSQVNGFSTTKEIVVSNNGLASLNISSVSVSGVNAAAFSQTNDCNGNNALIAAGGTCTIAVTFVASSIGTTTATLSIESNDPVNTLLDIELSGYGDSDSDGVLSATELAGPNQGDGNKDGISDEIQNNVTSFEIGQRNYVTLVAEDAQNAQRLNIQSAVTFGQVQLLSAIPADAPFTSLDYENYQFDINFPNNGITGDSTRVALYYPLQITPSSYYRYGPTPDNTAPHWYDFSFDPTTNTGASFVGRVSITSVSGAPLERNMVIINFVDGERGDDDLAANGKIVHAVGGVENKQSDGGASGSAVYLWIMALLFMCRKYIYKAGTNQILLN